MRGSSVSAPFAAIIGYIPVMRSIASRVGVCVIVLALVAGPSAASVRAQTGPPTTKAQQALEKALTRYLAASHGTDGALVVDLSTGQKLFSSSPGVGRLPASVEKLYTTTTALQEFGAHATLATTVLGKGTLTPNGTWQGTLYLRGGGDPTFGSTNFDNVFYGLGVGATAQQLAAKLAAAGIRRIDGTIVGDESYFDSLRGTPATGYSPDLEVEGQLSALAYDDGFLTTAADSLQPRPALYAVQQFVAALRGAGIKVPRQTHLYTSTTPSGATQLAAIRSPEMAALIKLTNAPSDNFFAETLLKDIGARFGSGGTTAAGAAVVRSVIGHTYGITPRLNDGSGLSRYDRTTPAQIVTLLEKQATDRDFVDSLAVAGISGTMQDEMLGTRAVGNCKGKTGTLDDVANLVGYCTARNGDTLAFAFLMNSLSDSTYGHELEDAMGVALANYSGPRATTTMTTTTPTPSGGTGP